MTVNLNGTEAGDDLLAALDGLEQEPTDDVEGDEGDELEAEPSETDEDEDAELEDEADADEGDDADEDTHKHTVKVGGEELTVSLQELKDGFMKDADYRRKTADVAETRKRVEAAEAQYKGGLETLEDQLTVVATFLANQLNVDEAEMDKLFAEKPAEAVRIQRQMQKQGSVLAAVHSQLQAVKKERGEVDSRKLGEYRDAENAKLVDANPEFRKPETTERLHSYLKDTFGLSKAEIESVADHRFALIAEKARRFDAAKAKAALKDKQVKKAPAKFQKAGASVRSTEAAKVQGQALKQVMKNGRVDDLAQMFG